MRETCTSCAMAANMAFHSNYLVSFWYHVVVVSSNASGPMPGHETPILQAFHAGAKAMKRHRRVLYIMYSEGSIAQRLKKHRNTGGALQVEWMHLISKASLVLNDNKQRIHFNGSNAGEHIGPVAWPAWGEADVWRLSTGEKQAVIGNNRVSTAPAADGEGVTEPHFTEEGGKTTPCSEPVFFHAAPLVFHEEMLHDYNLAALVDLTPGDGMRALAAIKSRIPYVGVAFGEAHREGLFAWLRRNVLACFQREGDALYRAEFAQLVAGTPTPSAIVAVAEEPKPKKAKMEPANPSAMKAAKGQPSEESSNGAGDARAALIEKIKAATGAKTTTSKVMAAKPVAVDDVELGESMSEAELCA